MFVRRYCDECARILKSTRQTSAADWRFLSPRALAKALHVPLRKVIPVLESKRGISAEIAVLLSVYFGTTDTYWTNLQAHDDLEVAKEQMREHVARIIPHARAKTVGRPRKSGNA